jgi:patatin-like phospholipase/acyl hydrolase
MPFGPANSIKVLAVDGGGIRGIIPAVILSEIHKRLSRDCGRPSI